MILIDAYRIKTGGGLLLLDYLLRGLKQTNVNYIILISKQVRIQTFYNCKAKFYCNNEINRNFTIYRLTKRYPLRKIFIFNNTPLLYKSDIETIVYFQNTALFDKPIKKIFLRMFYKNISLWIFQTNITKNLFQQNIGKVTFKILPFFEIKSIQTSQRISKIYTKKIFYPISSNYPHKNLDRLIKALELCSVEDSNFELILPLKAPYKSQRTYIRYLGPLSQIESQQLIASSDIIVFPSLNESFGLPLIEAAAYGKILLASDLDFVYEIVNPSATFNPLHIEDIKNKISVALTSKLKNSELRVENSLEKLIKLLRE